MTSLEREQAQCVVCGCSGGSVVACGYDYQYRTSGDKFFFVACGECGHVYLSPRPTPAALQYIYPENYYTREGRHRSLLVGFIKKHVNRKRLSLFGPIFEKQTSVLELGCGDCALLMAIKTRHATCSVTGIDLFLSQETINKCRSLQINLIQTDIETVELTEETYDLIIMNQLLEHLRDPGLLLGKVARALKPGGRISVETPNLNGYDRKLFKKSFWGGYYFPRHMHIFSVDTLKALIENNGLRIVKHASLTAPIIWIFSISALLGSVFPVFRRPESLPVRLFSDRNPFVLGFFALVDMTALLLGATTSNQQVVAEKPGEGNFKIV